MAFIIRLKRQAPSRVTEQTEVDATYFIQEDIKHGKFIQIDTYGSENRERIGAKSQSIRLTKDVAKQLLKIIDAELGD